MANANHLSDRPQGQTGAGARTPRPDATAIAVIGAGSIGVRLATAFLLGGFRVSLCDPDEARRAAAPGEIETAAGDLAAAGLPAGLPGGLACELHDGLSGAPAAPDQASADREDHDRDRGDWATRLSCTGDLAEAVGDVAMVLEAAPEKLDLKREIFTRLDAAAPPDAALASASSALTASQFAADLPGRERCLVAHPINPPHVIRMIELVPAPFTAPDSLARARALFASAGYDAVTVHREIAGFVYNRLQGAVLREAYCLVRDGVVGVGDLDRLVRDALGFRWSVVGPFETVDLNTRGGVKAHAEKLGPAYEAMGAERGQSDPWTEDLVEKVAAERRRLLPLDDWEARVAWRDRELAALAAFRAKRSAGRD